MNNTKPYPFELFTDGSYEFGTLNLKLSETETTQEPISILFMVDYSASMSDVCRDGRTKIVHLKHTLCRIIEEINNKKMKIYISVVAFDDNIHEIFDFVLVDDDNIKELIEKIEELKTRSSTNIEKALKEVDERIKREKRKCFNIFMTDGEVNGGEQDPNILSKLVNKNIQNIFIGFGETHDSHLLRVLSKTSQNNDYRFIDKLENSGLVYGEVLHNILYSVIEKPLITITNGEIYDWNTNKWETELNIPNLVSGTEKVFHVRTKTPENICGHLWKNIENSEDYRESRFMMYIEKLPDLINNDTDEKELCDLTPYMYRHKTQQLLFKVVELKDKEYKICKGENSVFGYFGKKNEQRMHKRGKIHIQKKELKKELKDFIKLLLEYKEKNTQSEHSSMIKLLCDDMYVAYKTIDTVIGDMYVASRQSSQGRQQVYTASQVDDNCVVNTKIKTQLMSDMLFEPISDDDFETIEEKEEINDDEEDDIFNGYSVNNDYETTPYSTPSMLKTMRAVSAKKTVI